MFLGICVEINQTLFMFLAIYVEINQTLFMFLAIYVEINQEYLHVSSYLRRNKSDSFHVSCRTVQIRSLLRLHALSMDGRE